MTESGLLFRQGVDHVVRESRWSGKWHIPLTHLRHEALCGLKARTPFGFCHVGDRQTFEDVVPHVICKHCRRKEAA